MTRFAPEPDPQSLPLFEQCLLGAAGLGLVALLSLPAARGMSAALGWMPLWLLLMPLAAWVALRVARRGRAAAVVHLAMPTIPRRRSADAGALRRRDPGNGRRSLPRAA